MRLVLLYLIGLLFGLGITISGMANPAKVLNFFDIAGSWDPSLAFVMGAALLVTFLGYRVVMGRQRPLLEPYFHMPKPLRVDGRLLGGSALFGVGWGLSGFCPGGAIPAIGTGRSEVILFIVALVAGMFAARVLPAILAGARARAGA